MEYIKLSDTVVEKIENIPQKSISTKVDYKRLRYAIKNAQIKLDALKAEAALCEATGIDPASVDTTKPYKVFGVYNELKRDVG